MKNFSIKRRVFIILLFKSVLFVILLRRMFYLQIKNYKKYDDLSSKNAIISIKINAPRGRILDKNGILLSGNKKLFRAIIFTKKKKIIEKNITILKEILPNYNFKSIDDIIKNQKKNSCDICILVENMEWEDMIKIEEVKFKFENIFIDHVESRFYLKSEEISHLIGYIDADSEPRSGTEKFLDKQLKGKNGQYVFEIDSTRSVKRLIDTKFPSYGNDVVLTIDSIIQSIIFDNLKKHTKASAAIMMNPNTGEIIASCSYPSFDGNKFISGSSNYINNIFKDDLCPLLNRAFSGVYMPGSLVKMLIGLAGLHYGVISRSTTFFCDRYIEVGGHKFHCWSKNGHNSVNLSDAISCSCDIYFYNLGMMLGVKKMSEFFRKFGLNEIFEDIPEMKIGILPDQIPVRYKADIIMASIGHGNFSTTLLHLAVMMSRLITNKKVTPHFIKQTEKKKFENLNINLNDMTLIIQSMYNAFNGEIGTGRGYKKYLKDIDLIGKTTTTQVISVKRDADGNKLPNQFREWKEMDHSMCACSFDFLGKNYVIALLIEHGGWGKFSAELCAKIVQQIYDQRSKIIQ